MAQRKGTGGVKVPGCYEALLEHQQKAVVSIDLRLLNWDLTCPHERAADRAALEYRTRLNPQPSALLARLLEGEPVAVYRRMLYLPPDAPQWLVDPGTVVRVTPDDVVRPAVGLPDQAAQMMALAGRRDQRQSPNPGSEVGAGFGLPGLECRLQ